MFAPVIVTMSSFAFFVLIDKDNVLDPKKAFVCIALFNILRFPMSMLPSVITGCIEANVSLGRIRSFLLKAEINQEDVLHEKIENEAISFENASLGWDMDKVFLKNLNFKVKQGDLVAVIGSVGSGKSSLLSAILGDMYKFEGKINVEKNIAYVSQQAWIQNATVKANILFGIEENPGFYEKVVDACQLRTDLAILAAGDMTEIGEKGINLSGGQKARINLARAVYSDASLYLLDDPLSAVDAHVSRSIFENIIGRHGMLKGKTRFFVTNSLNYLPQVDHIIMLSDGVIIESGTYDELSKLNGVFTEYMASYNSSDNFLKKDEPKTNEDEEIKLPVEEEKQSIVKKRTSFKCERAAYDKKNEAEQKDNPSAEKNKIIKEEQTGSGKVKFGTFLEYIKACKWWFTVIFFVLYLTGFVAQYASNMWLSDWTNNMAAEQSDPSKRNFRLLIYTVITLSQTFFGVFGDLIFSFMFIHACRALHTAMLHSILRCGMSFFESTPIGRILNRFSKDIEGVDNSIPESYKMVIRCAFSVTLSLVIISTSTPFFLLAFVPIAVIYFFIQRFYVAATRQLKRLDAVSRSPIFSHFGETLNGVSTIKAYSAQDRFIKIMEQNIDNNLVYFYPLSILGRWLACRLEFVGNLIGFFAAIFAVIGRNTVSAGAAGLSISFALNITQTLNWLVRVLSEFESNITSVERIKEYLDTKPHEAEWILDDKVNNDKSWPSEGNIIFNDYGVKYRDDLAFVLKHICCKIEPSEKIGIVGRTGAGKSSLTLALFRILESKHGKIVIDNVEINKLGLHNLRKKITIIPQEAFLFSGTLKMNIDPFGEYSDEALWDVLDKAHLKTFVEGLEDQLLFNVSEGGENLSVGQRQLVCLARALLRKTKILVLDEATASVDHNTDDLIQQTIRKEFHDCTILTIAHRINTIMDSTRIMVLDKGEIAEFDTPANLMANQNSLFYSIAKNSSRSQN
jgi:ABC-type multidrug transport system fused ATPase/permease subunit